MALSPPSRLSRKRSPPARGQLTQPPPQRPRCATKLTRSLDGDLSAASDLPPLMLDDILEAVRRISAQRKGLPDELKCKIARLAGQHGFAFGTALVRQAAAQGETRRFVGLLLSGAFEETTLDVFQTLSEDVLGHLMNTTPAVWERLRVDVLLTQTAGAEECLGQRLLAVTTPFTLSLHDDGVTILHRLVRAFVPPALGPAELRQWRTLIETTAARTPWEALWTPCAQRPWPGHVFQFAAHACASLPGPSSHDLLVSLLDGATRARSDAAVFLRDAAFLGQLAAVAPRQFDRRVRAADAQYADFGGRFLRFVFQNTRPTGDPKAHTYPLFGPWVVEVLAVEDGELVVDLLRQEGDTEYREILLSDVWRDPGLFASAPRLGVWLLETCTKHLDGHQAAFDVVSTIYLASVELFRTLASDENETTPFHRALQTVARHPVSCARLLNDVVSRGTDAAAVRTVLEALTRAGASARVILAPADERCDGADPLQRARAARPFSPSSVPSGTDENDDDDDDEDDDSVGAGRRRLFGAGSYRTPLRFAFRRARRRPDILRYLRASLWRAGVQISDVWSEFEVQEGENLAVAFFEATGYRCVDLFVDLFYFPELETPAETNKRWGRFLLELRNPGGSWEALRKLVCHKNTALPSVVYYVLKSAPSKVFHAVLCRRPDLNLSYTGELDSVLGGRLLDVLANPEVRRRWAPRLATRGTVRAFLDDLTLTHIHDLYSFLAVAAWVVARKGSGFPVAFVFSPHVRALVRDVGTRGSRENLGLLLLALLVLTQDARLCLTTALEALRAERGEDAVFEDGVRHAVYNHVPSRAWASLWVVQPPTADEATIVDEEDHASEASGPLAAAWHGNLGPLCATVDVHVRFPRLAPAVPPPSAEPCLVCHTAGRPTVSPSVGTTDRPQTCPVELCLVCAQHLPRPLCPHCRGVLQGYTTPPMSPLSPRDPAAVPLDPLEYLPIFQHAGRTRAATRPKMCVLPTS